MTYDAQTNVSEGRRREVGSKGRGKSAELAEGDGFWKARPTEKDAGRFWLKVEKGEGCWRWLGSLDKAGYGQFTLRKLTMRAHRFAYILAFGEVEGDSLFVCHRCDNPQCVRPDHLFLGSPQDNQTDMVEKARHWSVQQPGAWKDLCKRSALKVAPRVRGSEHPLVKLTEDSVRYVLRNPGASCASLGRSLGVSRTAIHCIRTGRTWAWLVEAIEEKAKREGF
jgi:hypothetical protein